MKKFRVRQGHSYGYWINVVVDAEDEDDAIDFVEHEVTEGRLDYTETEQRDQWTEITELSE